MTPEEAKEFGRYLRDARYARQWSAQRLGDAAGLNKSTIIRFELGAVSNPRTSHLVQIAEALGLPVTDVLAKAARVPAAELPALPTYLRTKYPQLSPEEVSGLSHYFEFLMNSHGYVPGGPAPGEDEAD